MAAFRAVLAVDRTLFIGPLSIIVLAPLPGTSGGCGCRPWWRHRVHRRRVLPCVFRGDATPVVEWPAGRPAC